MRRIEAPNQRLQDGIKRHYLSHEAEQLFSEKEKWFAEHFFNPFLEKDQTNFQYDERLYYFLISVLWRGLLHQLELPSIHNDTALSILKKVELDWRAYLLNDSAPLKFSDVNLWLTDHIKSHDTGVKGLDYYFTRTLDFTIIADEKGDYISVYCKFLKFVFCSTIKDNNNIDNSAVRVHRGGGSVNYPQAFQDSLFVETLVRRAKVISELPGPSYMQEEKIINEVKNNPDGFIYSQAGRSIMNDWRLDAITENIMPGRNEQCPCGSGKKFKKCHWSD